MNLVLSRFTRWTLILWLMMLSGSVSMLAIGNHLPGAGHISIWFRDNQNARQVRWDLRTHMTAYGDIKPYGGILSPDGTMVATASFQSGETRLYLSAPDSVERTLIGIYAYESTVAPLIWTADSQAILMVDTFASLVTHLVRIDIHTGEATVIFGKISSPAPVNGRQIISMCCCGIIFLTSSRKKSSW